MKCLIIAPHSEEEILFITPALRCLKTQLSATISVIIDPHKQFLLEENPNVDYLLAINESIRGYYHQIKTCDCIIDFRGSIKSFLGTLLTRKKTLRYRHLSWKKWLLCKVKINLLPNEHRVQQMLKTLSTLSVSDDESGLDFFIPFKDEVETSWLPETHQSGYVAVVISGSYATRQLPVKRLIELCDRINKPIILLGEKKDEAMAGEIEKFFLPGTKAQEKEMVNLNKKAIIFNACGKFSFHQSANMIQKADWVFTHDHVMMHVAAAFKKTIFSIWGNTLPEMGGYPYQTRFTIFENKKISCRPCSVGGFKKCPKGHFKCMQDVTFDFYLPD